MCGRDSPNGEQCNGRIPSARRRRVRPRRSRSSFPWLRIRAPERPPFRLGFRKTGHSGGRSVRPCRADHRSGCSGIAIADSNRNCQGPNIMQMARAGNLGAVLACGPRENACSRPLGEGGRTIKGQARSNCLDKLGFGVLNFPSNRSQNGLQMGLKKNFKKQLTVPV
jgi:hypothetical protein